MRGNRRPPHKDVVHRRRPPITNGIGHMSMCECAHAHATNRPNGLLTPPSWITKGPMHEALQGCERFVGSMRKFPQHDIAENQYDFFSQTPSNTT